VFLARFVPRTPELLIGKVSIVTLRPQAVNEDLMRLSQQSQETIRAITREIFGEGATVRLFGSRVDDQARGGDIDLLVELPEADPESRRKALTLVARLQQRLGDQPFDVLVVDPTTERRAIHRQAQKTGIEV
jgi:predicted nucleotidyltransferase